MNKDEILNALKGVIYPGFKKSIVEFGFVKDIKIGDKISIEVEIPSHKKDILRAVEDEILKLFPQAEVIVKSPQIDGLSDEPKINNIAPNISNFVMVSSGKGGVGKSTTTLNLAICAARLGKRVGVLDADIYGPNIPRMLGVDDVKPNLENERIEPISKCGIKMMSLGNLVDKGSGVIWRGAMVMQAIKQLLTDVNWGQLDILFIDMPPGTGDAQITLAQSVPVSAGICVSTPQVVALDDSERSLDMFKKLHIQIAGIIENMSGFICPDNGKEYEIFGKGGADALARKFGCEVLAHVPIEIATREAGDNGRPISFFEPNSVSAKRYERATILLLEKLALINRQNLADNSQIQPK